jgi:hypothetical protein
MHEAFDLQRRYMEEKRKGMKVKMEFSIRLQQELQNARRIDAARAKAGASNEQDTVAAGENE